MDLNRADPYTDLISNSLGLDFQDVIFSVWIFKILKNKSELYRILFIILRKNNTNMMQYR